MKLSDFLENVGRPLAFYPSLAKALGDRNESLFICQMAYWKGKESDPDGWIYKESDELETETSLTYKEQINVRKGLRKKGLLEERYARTEHKMYFRVNWDSVNELWEKHLTDGHMPPKHLTGGKKASSQRSGGSLPDGISLNSNSEITPETTQINNDSSASLIWEQVFDAIKPNLKGNHLTYVRGVKPISIDGGVLTLGACDELTRLWLQDRLTSTVNRLLIGILDTDTAGVVFEVAA